MYSIANLSTDKNVKKNLFFFVEGQPRCNGSALDSESRFRYCSRASFRKIHLIRLNCSRLDSAFTMQKSGLKQYHAILFLNFFLTVTQKVFVVVKL